MSKKVRKELMETKRECEHAAYVLGGAYRTLNALPNGEDKDHLISMLRTYVINNNCSLIVTPESPISAEHKLLIRDDCNGLIKGTSGHLSEGYVTARREPVNAVYNLSQYQDAFDESVFRREMCDYPTYRSVRNQLFCHLVDQRIPPEVIMSMTISDYRDFTREYCHDDFMKYREKEGFIKVFIRENEEEFRNLLQNGGVHPAYIEQLIKNMKEKGNAEEFEIEHKGQIITGPGFDIDHKNPIYCPNDVASYPEVNLPNSLCLVEKKMHRLKHKLERMVMTEDGVKMFEKILLPRQCAAMLDFEHYLIHDFDNPNRAISYQKPLANNLVHLNKIEQFVIKLGLQNENGNGKSAQVYVNRGKGGRK